MVALMLAQAGLRVTATDINPAAVRTAHAAAAAASPSLEVEAVVADILPSALDGADLILFNPPWLPTPSDGTAGESSIDRAS